jgi:hypothetical protein
MQYWAGLHPVDTQKAIDEGVELMLKMAFKLLGKQAKTTQGQLLLCGTSVVASDGGRPDDKSAVNACGEGFFVDVCTSDGIVFF